MPRTHRHSSHRRLSCRLILGVAWLALLGGCAGLQTWESVDDPGYRPSLRAGNNGLRFIDGQLFYLYVPQAVLDDPAGSRLLVAVHDTDGRLDGYRGGDVVRLGASRWASLAESNRWVVLAPQFDATRFDRDYRLLNLGGMLRADERLHALVGLVGELLPGLRTERLFLFGFAGGAEFVHRYAMLHPARVERAVAAGADWYTFPDPDRPFPLGVRRDSLPADLGFEPGSLGSMPLLLVAESGSDRESLRREVTLEGRVYDLVEWQGESRAERARNWLDAIASGDARGEGGPRFESLPAGVYRISEAMRELAARFLSD